MTLFIYGYGGLGRELYDMAQYINDKRGKWNRIMFVDDDITLSNDDVITFEELRKNTTLHNCEIIIAIGEPLIRAKLNEKVKKAGFHLTKLIHPKSNISEKANINTGVIVSYGSFVSCGVHLGENVLIQPNSTISHDCHIGDNSVVSSLCVIAGNCKIGENTYVAIQSCVREGITIGSESIIGMGSIVTKNIPDNVVAYGSPAKIHKNNDAKKVFKNYQNEK